MKKTSIIAAITTLVAVVTVSICFRAHHSSEQTTKPLVAARPPALVIRKLDKPIVQTMPETVSLENLTEQSKASKLATLRQYLPSLDAIPNDWRTYRPDDFVVSPHPDMYETPFTFAHTSSKEILERQVETYESADGSFVTTAATKNEMFANVTISGGDVFEIQIKDGDVAVRTAPVGAECGAPTSPHSETHDEAADNTPHRVIDAEAAPANDGTPNISNVLVLYTKPAAQALGNATQSTMKTKYIAMFESANVCLSRSGVPLQWVMVGCVEMPAYTSFGNDSSKELNLIRTRGMVEQFNTRDQYDAHVWAMSQLRAADADQALLVSTNTDLGGLAATFTAVHFLSHNALINVGRADYITLAHELAHNFGCLHDRETANAQNASPDRYYYGYRLSVDNSGTNYIGTIMSYSKVFVPYYSSPLTSFTQPVYDAQGHAMPSQVPMGIPQGQVGAADNARWLTEHAADMRGSAEWEPIITAPENPQPNNPDFGQSTGGGQNTGSGGGGGGGAPTLFYIIAATGLILFRAKTAKRA